MACTRREFFSRLSRSLVSEAVDSLHAIRGRAGIVDALQHAPPKVELARWLRPPGALPEHEFLATCTQCTDCQTACPYDAIKRLGPEFGKSAGTPAIIPSESACYLCEDMPCVSACKPLALLPIAIADVAMGTAVIDLQTCYLSQGQPCDYCVARCPVQARAIGFGEDRLPVISEDGCVGCGVCDYICPADAITIRPKLISSHEDRFRNK